MSIIRFFICILCIIGCLIGLATDGWLGFWSMFLVIAPLFVSVGWFGFPLGFIFYLPIAFVFAIVFFTAGSMFGIPGVMEPSPRLCIHQDESMMDGEFIVACDICTEARGKAFADSAISTIENSWSFFKRYWIYGLGIIGALFFIQGRNNR